MLLLGKTALNKLKQIQKPINIDIIMLMISINLDTYISNIIPQILLSKTRNL